MTEFAWAWPEESDALRQRATEIGRELGVPEMLGIALARRDLDVSGIAYRSLEEATEDIGDPDRVDEAADMLIDAARSGQVGVLCDYDVDGATSQAILIEALREVLPAGSPTPPVVLPDRNTEGFGPNERCLRELAEQGVKCVAVLDCGTASGPLLDRYHAEAGMVPVIIDHHPLHGAKPLASGTAVNPWIWRDPDPGEQGTLCAAGLAWFVGRAILRRAGLAAARTTAARKRMTTLAALGTVCDVMPLNQPFNRALVRTGVSLMLEPDAVPPGIRAICEVGKIQSRASVDAFGWRIGPRINAGSRMGESSLAAECVRETNLANARTIARALDLHNSARRALGQKEEREMDASPELEEHAKGPVIVHRASVSTPGTVGLVASSLVKRFGWPALALTKRKDGLLAGSGRSSLGFDIGAAVSAAMNEGIVRTGGGHAMACGVKIEPDRLQDFKAFLLKRFAEHAATATCPTVPTHEIEAVLGPASLEAESFLKLAEAQARLEPWGQAFEKPLFAVKGCAVHSVRQSQQGSLFFDLVSEEVQFNAVWWQPPEDWRLRLLLDAEWGSRRSTVEVIGDIDIDDWKGLRKGQLSIKDARSRDPAADG